MIITRDIIADNFSIKVLNPDGIENTVDKDFIIRAINGAKSYLIKEKNVKPGQKIIIIHNAWPDYVVWFFAAAELGLSFVVSDYPRLNNSVSVQKKLSLYGSLDLVITYPGVEISNFFSDDQNKIIEWNEFLTYPPERADEIWANEKSILIYSTSSGTTGTPKVIKHSHEFFYRLAKRNAALYNLSLDDRCLHSKSLHHGSVTGVYFLPTIMSCSHHFHTRIHPKTPALPWVRWAEKHNINRLFLMQETIEQFSFNITPSIKNQGKKFLYILSKIDDNSIQKIIYRGGYRISSIFGCTETSGPLFLPTWSHKTKRAILTHYMGKPLDDFYKLTLNDKNLLEVTMPDGEVVCTGDRFEIIDNQWIYRGRENTYKINGVPLYLDLLIDCLENFFKKNHGDFFDLVIDSEHDMIYIRLNSPYKLYKINEHIKKQIVSQDDSNNPYIIHKQIIGPRSDFITGIKFDPEEIRIRCRQINI